MKVAVVQTSSVPFNTEKTIDKLLIHLEEATSEGAKLVVFPEAFIGGYPKGASFGVAVGYRSETGRDLFADYFVSAIELNGPELARVKEANGEDITIVVGIIEKVGFTLYCTAVTILGHEIINYHRKLMPTGSERLIWGFGDGSTIKVVDTPVGRVGTVICWENYMPLLRQAMYGQDIEIYCAPTVDDRPTWSATMKHIALEGRVHVLSANQVIRWDEFPEGWERQVTPERETFALKGGSMIVSPAGEVLAGPLFDEHGILYADIDRLAKTRSHLDLDVVGHYARPDVFKLTVNTSPTPPVDYQGE